MNEREYAIASITQAMPVLEKVNEMYMSAYTLLQRQKVWETFQFDPVRRKALAKRNTTLTFAVMDFVVICTMLIIRMFEKLLSFLPFLQRVFTRIGMIGLFGLVIGTFVAMAVVYYGTLSPSEEELAAKEQLEQKNRNAIDAISADVCQVFQENEEIISRIPQDYRNYDALCFFRKMFENHRADSMKEAMNLYDEYLHRKTLENNSSMLQKMAQKQSEMLRNIEENMERIERNTRLDATFSILSFMILADMDNR